MNSRWNRLLGLCALIVAGCSHGSSSTPSTPEAAVRGAPSVGITPIAAILPQAPNPKSDQPIVGGGDAKPVPAPPQSQTLFRDDFSDVKNSRSGVSDRELIRDSKRTRDVLPFAAQQFNGRLALIVSELPEAAGADGRPGVLRVQWERVPESIVYTGFRYHGRLDRDQRFKLPQIMTARKTEDLRGFKFRAKFKAENEKLGAKATIKFDLRIEPFEDRDYVNRLDCGTIEATSMWKPFEIDLADATNGDRFLASFSRRGSGMCALIFAQAGPIQNYHDGDGLLIDDIEILDQRPPKK